MQNKRMWMWAGVLIVATVAVMVAKQVSPDDADDRITPAILVSWCENYLRASGSMMGLTPNLGCDSDRNIGEGMPMPSKGILQHLAVASATPGAADSDGVFTVFVNNAPTSITCTVGTRLSCIDKVHIARVNAGDLVEIRFTTGFMTLSDARATLNKR